MNCEFGKKVKSNNLQLFQIFCFCLTFLGLCVFFAPFSFQGDGEIILNSRVRLINYHMPNYAADGVCSILVLQLLFTFFLLANKEMCFCWLVSFCFRSVIVTVTLIVASQ